MPLENLIAYFVVLVIFVLGFMPMWYPIMDTAVTQNVTVGNVTVPLNIAHPEVVPIIYMIVPFVLLIFIVCFFLRMRGDQPFGQW